MMKFEEKETLAKEKNVILAFREKQHYYCDS